MRAAVVCFVALFIGLAVCSTPRPLRADGEATGGTQLRQELEGGLKARQPEEFAFIARVVERVDGNQLPLDMVKGTFKWARQKNPRIPMPYFEQALRIRAGELGISLD